MNTCHIHHLVSGSKSVPGGMISENSYRESGTWRRIQKVNCLTIHQLTRVISFESQCNTDTIGRYGPQFLGALHYTLPLCLPDFVPIMTTDHNCIFYHKKYSHVTWQVERRPSWSQTPTFACSFNMHPLGLILWLALDMSGFLRAGQPAVVQLLSTEQIESQPWTWTANYIPEDSKTNKVLHFPLRDLVCWRKALEDIKQWCIMSTGEFYWGKGTGMRE